MTDIQGPARLGKPPTLKHVGEDKKPVCELTVIFLNYRMNKNDEENPIDRGFWVKVSVWGKFAEQASKMFSKGDKVFIADGNMDQDSFTAKDAQDGDDDIKLLHVDCNLIFPWVPDLESLSFKERKGKQQPTDSTD